MSADIESDGAVMSSCASCGVKESDDVKLKNCTACYLVKYCGVKCQKEHRPKHKRACKLRAAELRDEILFRQPESSYLGDCPICFLPLPIDKSESIMTYCCSKVICAGCCYANQKREWEEKLDHKCPFCRKPAPTSEAEWGKRLNDRAKMNDPVALCQVGVHCYKKEKAAELGDVAAHYILAVMYDNGEGVKKDKSKELYHCEQAAIGGHPVARHNLGSSEWRNRCPERAVKHWIIAAKLGQDDSLEKLEIAYKDGLVSEDDFTAAFRGHQAAVDATKSPLREVAEAV